MTLKVKEYSFGEKFGIPELAAVRIAGYEPGHVACPPENHNYVFQRDKMRDMTAFWQSGLIALKIKGDPATGKTSLVEQWHARLGWPLYKVACNRRLEAGSLIGRLVPTAQGNLQWVDGPLLRAAKEGTSILLDEYNALDPDESNGLNMLLEGYSFTVPETGEVCVPAKGFRVFATENSVHSKLAVVGRNVQDTANDDRWMIMSADYLPKEAETKCVKLAMVASGVTDAKAEMFATQAVELAHTIRQAWRQDAVTIEKPISTRSLIRWGLLFERYQKVPKELGGPLLYSLSAAFDMPPDMKTTVATYLDAQLGLAA